MELHGDQVTWAKFKSVFQHRFRDVHTDQYHFTQLHTARQDRDESSQEFADRCRGLSQKIVCKVDYTLAQRIHYENAERILLASLTAGLRGEVGKQVRFRTPSSMEEALRIAPSVDQAVKQERFNEVFYTRFNNSVNNATRQAQLSLGESRTARSADDSVRRNTLSSQQRTRKLSRQDTPRS